MASNTIRLEYIQKGVEQVKKDLGDVNSKVAEANKNKVAIQFEVSELNRYKNDLQSLLSINHSIREAMKGISKDSEAWATLNRESNKCYKSIANLKKALVECGDEGAKAIIETINAQQKFDAQIEQSVRVQKTNAEAFSRMEKEKQQSLKQTEKDMQNMEQLLTKMQSISRMMSDQQNAGKTGKKGKTSYDIAWAIEQYKTLNAEAERLAGILGEDNEAVQHFRNGMAWTEANNPIRALRDEATKLIPKIAQAEAELKKLSVDPSKNSNQIAQTTKSLEEMKARYKEIEDSFQQSIDKIKENKSGVFDAQDLSVVQQTLDLLKEQLATLTEIKVKKEEARAADKMSEQDYQQLKQKIQEIYSLEEKLEKLKKDKSGNRPEIQATEEILNNKKKEIDVDLEISKLNGQRKTELEAIKQKHQENLKVIESQKDKMSSLGDTIQKVFNCVAVYKGFTLLTEGIQKAIDTMKDLDAAFTDIQMVTMDSDAQTAELAQSYNKLAKQLGATTTEVAEGAGEWLRQGKTTEETTELLKASMTLSKVGAIESSQATELLTSSLNGYKLEAKDAMSVVDKISAIDLEAATSSEELATALSRTANVANDSNVSFDKLLAMIGTVSSVTRRSASTIRRSI